MFSICFRIPETLFLSTLSLRRATLDRASPLTSRTISIHALLAESDLKGLQGSALRKLFLSTLSLRRATDAVEAVANSIQISIHALLAESDPLPKGVRAERLISIHALLAESDSTASIRTPAYRDFYPRSPCGERHPDGHQHIWLYRISIHALLAESDGLPPLPVRPSR